MRIVETKVLKYHELDDKAKEKARDWYRNASGGDVGPGDNVVEQAVETAALFGITVKTRPVRLMGGGTRQDPDAHWTTYPAGASLSGTYRFVEGGAAAVKAEWPEETELHRIVDTLDELQRRHGGKFSAALSHGRGVGVHQEVEPEFDGGEDEVTAQEWGELRGALLDFARWIGKSIEAEYDYQNSDEVVADTIAINEYEFTEDGKRYRF